MGELDFDLGETETLVEILMHRYPGGHDTILELRKEMTLESAVRVLSLWVETRAAELEIA